MLLAKLTFDDVFVGGSAVWHGSSLLLLVLLEEVHHLLLLSLDHFLQFAEHRPVLIDFTALRYKIQIVQVCLTLVQSSLHLIHHIGDVAKSFHQVALHLYHIVFKRPF